jgi:hypothetical protein
LDAPLFFNTRDGSHVLTVPEGLEFVSLEARKSALVSLAEMTKDLFEAGQLKDVVVIIRDAEGDQLLTVSLLLRIEQPRRSSG